MKAVDSLGRIGYLPDVVFYLSWPPAALFALLPPMVREFVRLTLARSCRVWVLQRLSIVVF